MPRIDLTRVGVTIDRTRVLSDVSLTIGHGEVVGVSGPNGSGKTTLLRLLATLQPATGGHGTVLGTPLDDARQLPAARRRIGFISHDPALYPDLTLRENLDIAARLLGATEDAVSEAIRQVGLAAAQHRRAAQASLGMRRRIEFARLLVQGPDLVLLDEAHAGLDADAHVLVTEVVRRVRESGGAAVLVSHETDRIAPLTTRLLDLVDGTVVARS